MTTELALIGLTTVFWLNMMDAFSTYFGIKFLGKRESNKLFWPVLNAFGFRGLAALKLIGGSAFCIIIYAFIFSPIFGPYTLTIGLPIAIIMTLLPNLINFQVLRKTQSNFVACFKCGHPLPKLAKSCGICGANSLRR